MLVRRGEMRASKIMQQRVKNAPNIEILWNTETKEVLGDEEVNGVKVVNNQTGEERVLDAQGFFVAIGHQPNTAIFKDWLDMDDQGYIKTIPGSSRTNIPGVCATGDAQDKIYRQAVTAAGSGCMGALDAEKWIAEKEVELQEAG